jgi:putative SOS response-associated peptidase YedK
MCARFTIRRRLNLMMQELADLLPGYDGLFDWDPTPAFNICPTQTVAAVRPTAAAGGRELVPLKWRLIRPGRRTRRSPPGAFTPEARRSPRSRPSGPRLGGGGT